MKKIGSWLFFSLLLLSGLPAQATDYIFPNTLPLNCSIDNSGGSGRYSCAALSLADGDTVKIAGVTPATITFSGAFGTGAGVMINDGGSTSNLTLVVNGAATLGAGSTLIGNLTTLGAGAVSIAVDSWISGNVSTEIGFVAMGATSTKPTGVGGSIRTITGYVGLGAGGYVGGPVNTGIGYVSLGAGGTINGAVTTTTAGYVGLGAGATLNGDVLTKGAGSVLLGASSTVKGSITAQGTTGADYITTADSSKVNCNISAASSYITLGAKTSVGGSVIAKDYVTVGAGVYLAGNVTSTENYVVVADGSTVMGKVVFKTYATIDAGARVYYDVVDTSACATPGTPTATGLFDCLETGKQNPSLYTKLAGTDFTFDIAALKTDKTLESSYVPTGGTAKYVRVELFDDTIPPASCAAYDNLVAAQTRIASFTESSAGLTTLTEAFNLPNVYQKLRCRVTECKDSSCADFAASPTCSSDQFSVRPVAVTLTTTANALAPSWTSAPVIKAGANFDLSAVTGSDNYSGPLTLDTSKLTVEDPGQNMVGVLGTLTPLTLAVNGTASNNVSYSEAGYLYLAPGAFHDDTFTQVDSANGDCIANSLSDSLSGGQYGCRIGNTANVTLGRFIPDHFAVSVNQNGKMRAMCTPNATDSFTYTGQAIDYLPTSLPSLTIKPMSAGGVITQNYQGDFQKLTATGVTITPPTADSAKSGKDGVTKTALTATMATGSLTNAGGTMIYELSSSDQFTYIRNANALVASYTTGLPLGVSAVLDSDGVVSNAGSLPTLNPTGVNLRYGRLKIENAYGSELLDLPMPVEAQYWNGSSFAVNSSDSCTTLASNHIARGNYRGTLSASTITVPDFHTADINGSCSAISPVNGVMKRGKSCILFGKPLVSGSVDLLINLGSVGLPANCLNPTLRSGGSIPATLAHLSGNWCGSAADRDPGARATFGNYNGNGISNTQLIYFREVY